MLNLANKINYGLKIDLIDTSYVLNFIKEINKIYKILSSKASKNIKFIRIQKTLRANKNLFNGTCGVGMNYFVGYKK